MVSAFVQLFTCLKEDEEREISSGNQNDFLTFKQITIFIGYSLSTSIECNSHPLCSTHFITTVWSCSRTLWMERLMVMSSSTSIEIRKRQSCNRLYWTSITSQLPKLKVYLIDVPHFYFLCEMLAKSAHWTQKEYERQPNASGLIFNYLTLIRIVYRSNATHATPLDIETMYGENNDTFIIKLKPAEVTNTTLQVNLKFVSQLSSTLQGFYRTNYEDSDSDTRK